ncbi:MAG: methyltransferase domain-containing protein [Anaerolineae bacterium]|nr:methyltransferase domain-containing protein [Anaerolineae bacterium]
MRGSPLDYDEVAAVYARHRQVHPDVLAALCDRVRAQGPPPAVRVLEVGCGTGNYVRALRTQLDCPAWGLDPSIAMLAQARARDADVAWQVGRAEALPYAGARFDMVYSVDVIHHVADRAATMREAYRVLDAGGWICTATDSAWIIRHRAPLSTYFPETVPLELARYPRIAVLEEMMAAAGFGRAETRTVSCAYETTAIDAYRARAFSALHLISDAAFARGLARMERDLAHGPIRCVARYTLLWGRKKMTSLPPPPGVITCKSKPGGEKCATK